MRTKRLLVLTVGWLGLAQGCSWANLDGVCFQGEQCPDGGAGGGGGGGVGGGGVGGGGVGGGGVGGGGVGGGGNPADGGVVAMPPTLNFGTVEVGKSSQLTLSIFNGGPDPVPGLNVSVSPPTQVLSVLYMCPQDLPVLATCLVTVTFAPVKPLPIPATIDVNSMTRQLFRLPVIAAGAYVLTVTLDGGGLGSVVTSAAGIQCDGSGPACSTLFVQGPGGNTVTVDAHTQNGSQTRFLGWNGCDDAGRACSVTMDTSRRVDAVFEQTSSNLAFVTSGMFPIPGGGHTEANARCNQLATLAGINDTPGTAFLAWLGTTQVPAMATFQGIDGGFLRMDGAPFAFTKQALLGGQVLVPLNIDEWGQRLPQDEFAWTGSDNAGGIAFNCGEWSSTAGNTPVGWTQGGPGQWSNGQSLPCGANAHFFCLQTTSGAPITPPPLPTNAKVVYFTSTPWAPDGGLNTADSFCNSHRPSGLIAIGSNGQNRSYVAFLPNAGLAAKARIQGNGAVPYYRPDGIFVGMGQDLIDGKAPNGIWATDNLTIAPAQTRVWTGASPDGGTAETCGDWVGGSGSGRVGLIYTGGNSPQWLSAPMGFGTSLCSTAQALICIEP